MSFCFELYTNIPILTSQCRTKEMGPYADMLKVLAFPNWTASQIDVFRIL